MSAGVELPEVAAAQSFVDEDAEFEDEVVTKSANKGKKFDWDEFFAYRTFKVVRIQDMKLGLLYWVMVSSVIFYIIFFAFGIEGKHQRKEWGTGTVIVRFKGKAFCQNRVFDASDLRSPEVEPYGAFIMTKALTTKNQKIGNCVNFDKPCPCGKGEECIPAADDEDKGFCQSSNWCPSLGDGNSLAPPGGTQVDIMEGLEHTILEIQSGISFPQIGNYFFVTGASAGASNPYTNMTLGKLLEQATPPTKLADIIHTGALISVSFYWTCDVDFECEPEVVIRRVDGGKGFRAKRASSWTKAGVTTRDARYEYGIRLLVDSSGMGRRVSLVMIILQIGSGMALLRTASMCTDFLMLNLYSKKRREAYYKCKVIPTKDYSDLQDRINLIQEEKDRMDQANDPNPLKGGGGRARLLGGDGGDGNPNPGVQPLGAGASVVLGLGPGGRGGVPSKALSASGVRSGSGQA